jgi:hypothetical protein
VIKVRQDDIIIIYSGAKFQRNRYNSTSAENLKTLVEGDTSSFVFGVSIQNTHPRVLKGGVAPSNYGFVGYSIHNVDDYHGTALYSSSCQISTNKDVIRLSVLVSTKGIEVFMEKGGAGVLLRNGKVVERFDFDQRLIPFKSGDIVLVMLPANSKNNLPLDRAIALIKQGRRLFLGPTFPNVISFVATIVDNVPNYLEDAAVVGEGSVDCGIFYHHDEFRSTWWFEENTMNGVTALAEIIHVKEEEIKDNVDDLAARVGGIRMDDEAIEFKMNTFKFTHLKPRDIISIISGEEGVEEVSVSTIRRALSGCKTSADLKNALQKLKFHPSTTAMAAFVSDKVPPSKMKMANFITNETADANKTASWTKSDNEIKVSSPGGASGSASAAIMFRGRNRVAISQKGGAVALIINDKGLKHGDKVAFNNTLRKLKLEDGNGISNHANLEVEPGDVVMVLLPAGVGEYKLNPYEIGAIIMDDLDDSENLPIQRPFNELTDEVTPRFFRGSSCTDGNAVSRSRAAFRSRLWCSSVWVFI